MVHRSQTGLHGVRDRDVLGHIVIEQGDVQSVDNGSCPRLLPGSRDHHGPGRTQPVNLLGKELSCLSCTE